jgi:ATP-dependent DNA helicase RecG
LSTEINLLLLKGMGLGLHWFPEDFAPERLAATLAGMANSGGGTVLIGIAPRSGHVQGVKHPQECLDKIFQAALSVEPTLVLPIPRFITVDEQNKVFLVSVPEGLPHVYSLDGRYFGREGRQTQPLSARRLRQLLLERGAISFESRVPPGAELEDLDSDQVAAYLEAVGLAGVLSPGEALLQRGCLQRVDGRLKPTYAALLLFGRHPQQWLPGSTILAAQFHGPAFSDHFIKQEFAGTLPDQIRRAEAFVRESLRQVVRLSGLVRQEVSEYPLEAVRELLVNAAAHRDYNIQGDSIHLNLFADRLEVQSPGTLPGPVNLDNLLEARFSRNAIITQVLSDLGFVERLGYGLDRVVAVLRQNNLMAPRFDETAGCFRVTLFGPLEDEPEPPDLSVFQQMNLNARQERAVAFLVSNRRITNRAYQDLCPGVHSESLRRDLADMVAKGLLLKIGDKRATYYILKK